MSAPHTPHGAEPKHTPDPWSVSGDGKILGPRDGCSHVIVAAMPVWWANQAPGSHASQDLQATNAALIARAPDLLAECERLRSALEGVMRYYIGERSSQNVVGEAGKAADAARAALAFS